MPSLTRYAVERIVVDRLGRDLGVLGRSGLSAAADPTVPNPDLDGPIALALLTLGIVPDDPATPQDAGLALVPPSRWRYFLALVELNLREAVLAVLRRLVTQESAPDRLDLSDMARGLAQDIQALRARIAVEFVVGGSSLVVSSPGMLGPPDAACLPVWSPDRRTPQVIP
jgi:hypothetical protein